MVPLSLKSPPLNQFDLENGNSFSTQIYENDIEPGAESSTQMSERTDNLAKSRFRITKNDILHEKLPETLYFDGKSRPTQSSFVFGTRLDDHENTNNNVAPAYKLEEKYVREPSKQPGNTRTRKYDGPINSIPQKLHRKIDRQNSMPQNLSQNLPSRRRRRLFSRATSDVLQAKFHNLPENLNFPVTTVRYVYTDMCIQMIIALL